MTATGSGGTGSYTYLWYENGNPTGITTRLMTLVPSLHHLHSIAPSPAVPVEQLTQIP